MENGTVLRSSMVGRERMAWLFQNTPLSMPERQIVVFAVFSVYESQFMDNDEKSFVLFAKSHIPVWLSVLFVGYNIFLQ